MKKTLFFLSLLIAFVMVSCDNKLMMTLPEGPQGPQGESGLSAFDLWKEFYGKPDATLEEFLNSLKGDKGEKGDTPAFNVTIGDDNFWYINGKSTGVKATGSDGIDGVSPDFDVEIGTNGNWYINGEDTGKPSQGKDGNTPKIEIRSDGYWYINGEKSVKAEGIDGKDGEDGKTPVITINEQGYWVIDGKPTKVYARAPKVTIGTNGNWFIDGVDTGKPSKGEDGEVGKTPEVTIGVNGNWFIDGVDTGRPSKGVDGENGADGEMPEISIGDNGNWVINGIDTNRPSKGKDGTTPVLEVTISDNGTWVINGVDTKKPTQGDSAYEVWVKAVNDGQVKNKDGSDYIGGTTREEYLKWLQGGDISTLYIHWRDSNPANKDKTIDDFLEELFSCHCDGINLYLEYSYGCIVVDDMGVPAPINRVVKLYVDADKDTKLVIKNGATVIGTYTISTTQLTVNLPQSYDVQNLTLEFTLPAKQGTTPRLITKNIMIDRINYIEGMITSVEDIDSSSVLVSIVKPADNVEIEVDGEQLSTETGWDLDASTYSKVFMKGAEVKTLLVEAKKAGGSCTTAYVKIAQLQPVEVETPVVSVDPSDSCNWNVEFKGTPGMTVKATYWRSGAESNKTEVDVFEESGVYTLSIPRGYTRTYYSIIASKPGAGDKVINSSITGNFLLAQPIRINQNEVKDLDRTTQDASYIEFNISNPLNQEIEITARHVKGRTAVNTVIHEPWISNADGSEFTESKPAEVNTPAEYTFNIPAQGTVKVRLYRNHTYAYEDGNYTAKFQTYSQCGEYAYVDVAVTNQKSFKYTFSHVGGATWDPETELYTIKAILIDAMPNTPIQIMLARTISSDNEITAYYPYAYGETNSQGYLEVDFKMSEAEYDIALDRDADIQFNLPGGVIHKSRIKFSF